MPHTISVIVLPALAAAWQLPCGSSGRSRQSRVLVGQTIDVPTQECPDDVAGGVRRRPARSASLWFPPGKKRRQPSYPLQNTLASQLYGTLTNSGASSVDRIPVVR
jgi:hypothetical protein